MPGVFVNSRKLAGVQLGCVRSEGESLQEKQTGRGLFLKAQIKGLIGRVKRLDLL